jgi:peptide/nickel transport system permease protein
MPDEAATGGVVPVPEADALSGPAPGPGVPRAVGRFLRRRPLGALGVAVALAMLAASLGPPEPRFGLPDLPDRPLGFQMGRPFLARYGPEDFFRDDSGRLARFQPPSGRHWLGTDDKGRDVWARLVWGTRRSLFFALWALVLATVGGTAVGLASAYFLGWVDMVVQRLMDGLQSFPPLLVLMLVVTLTEPSLRVLAFALAVVALPSVQRVVRSVVLAVREEPYVLAARALGASHLRTMLRHVLPNVMAPVLTVFSVGLGSAVLAEAAISFVDPSTVPQSASWGIMLAEGRAYMFEHPHVVLAAGGAIAGAVLAFNLAGDALRDVLDPRLRVL